MTKFYPDRKDKTLEKKVKGLGMISGGLDSLLAVGVLRQQDIVLKGLHYLNGYSQGNFRKRVYDGMTMAEIASARSKILSDILGIEVDVIDVSEEFLDVLRNPRHGFGKNVNPCIDCRIFLLNKARERMAADDADFIFTGEVLGQRPMSQHRRAMDMVERESGLSGKLLRPLCAKLLPPTRLEREGLIDRDLLLDIQGRSRKRQLELAEQLGVKGFGAPAGGCALTDENYARKFRDFVEHGGSDHLTTDETLLLSTGRHFRLTGAIKAVVGRNRQENEYLEAAWNDCWLVYPRDIPGPTVLVQGDPDEEVLRSAASLMARYSDGKRQPSVIAVARQGEREIEFEAFPAEEEDIEAWRL